MCCNNDTRVRGLTMGLRFSTRWMPTIPRNAPKLSWRHKEIKVGDMRRNIRVQREEGAGSKQNKTQSLSVWGGDCHSRWCRSNIQRQARCLCEWPRPDPQSAPPEPEPAETRSPTEPISSGAGTELRRNGRKKPVYLFTSITTNSNLILTRKSKPGSPHLKTHTLK